MKPTPTRAAALAIISHIFSIFAAPLHMPRITPRMCLFRMAGLPFCRFFFAGVRHKTHSGRWSRTRSQNPTPLEPLLEPSLRLFKAPFACFSPDSDRHRRGPALHVWPGRVCSPLQLHPQFLCRPFLPGCWLGTFDFWCLELIAAGNSFVHWRK